MRGFFMHPLNTRLALIGGRGKVSQETETRRGLTHWVFFDVRARSSGADIFVVVRGFSLVFAISYLFLSLVLSGVFFLGVFGSRIFRLITRVPRCVLVVMCASREILIRHRDGPATARSVGSIPMCMQSRWRSGTDGHRDEFWRSST